VVGQILEPRLHAPIVFASHEHERIGLADLAGERLHRGRRLARCVLFIHAVEHRQANRLGVDQLGLRAARLQRRD